MSDYFVFGGYDTRQTCDVYRLSVDSAPNRSLDARVIPGRSGDFILDEKRYPNVEQSYTCIIHEDMEARLSTLRNALLSKIGYQRLEDNVHSDEFYLAYVSDEITPQIDRNRTMAKAVVTFTRKPQRYLKSGEATTSLTASGSISNPTMFDSKPLIRIYGKGVVQIADNAITVISSDEYVDIDCEMMEAYKGPASCNSMVTIQNLDFPKLHPGTNGIVLGSGVTRVDITPRWYRL